MWIKKVVWKALGELTGDLRQELAVSNARNLELERHVASLRSASDYQRLRINQLEMREAAVLSRDLQVPIPTPSFGENSDPQESVVDFQDPEEHKFATYVPAIDPNWGDEGNEGPTKE